MKRSLAKAPLAGTRPGPKPLDARTLRAVVRWHRSRERGLNWSGMRATLGETRNTLFAQAEAHGNSATHWLNEARAIERKAKKGTGKHG